MSTKMILRWREKAEYFWKLRRQNDRVKLICMFALAGAAFFTGAVYHTVQIYHYVNTPAEYVLTGGGEISAAQVDALMQNEAVTGVSRQAEVPMTIVYRGIPVEMSCTLLSREYMEKRFGAMSTSGTRRIYMDENAFRQWQQMISESDGNLEESEGREQDAGVLEFDVRYRMEEEASAQDGESLAPATSDKSARVVVVRTGVQAEEGFIYSVGDDGRLLREADGIRVQFAGHDLDGLQVDGLRKMGYEIDNEAVGVEEEYEVKMELLSIRYGMLSGGICLVAAFVLGGVVREELRGSVSV